MKKTIAILVALLIAGTGALAMPVRSTTDPITVTAHGINDLQDTLLTAQQFQLIGVDENGDYIVYSNDRFYTVSPTELLLSGIESLPNIADFQALRRGSKGDDALVFQQALVSLGYLAGGADGVYGGMTEEAVKAFQAALAMEETGEATPYLQMLAISMTQPELVLSDTATPYDAFAEQTGIDAKYLAGINLIIDYDDMTGTGFISDGTVIEFEAGGASDIDRYVLTAQFGLSMTAMEDGTMAYQPAVKLSCLGIQRPVISEVIVKSGNARGTATIENVASSLDGIQILEQGTAVLDDAMVEALAGAETNGELKLRVIGRYNTFDLQVPAEYLHGLSAIGGIAQML